MSPSDIDGGWGWVVCFACFIVHVLVDGMQYSSGIIFVALMDYFHESKGNTAFVASLAPSVNLITGPLVVVLVNRSGCRTVAIAGGLIASISQFVSVFAPSIQFLYITLGIMIGIGYGMAYFSSIVVVNQYFDKKRSIAIGLALSGSGFGTLMFGPVMNLLLETYTWQGTILISSALMLNTVVCGILYRPVSTEQSVGDLNIATTKTHATFAKQQGYTPLPETISCFIENEDGERIGDHGEAYSNMTIYEQTQTVVSERQYSERDSMCIYKNTERVQHDSGGNKSKSTEGTGKQHVDSPDTSTNSKDNEITEGTNHGQCNDSSEKKLIPNRRLFCNTVLPLIMSTLLNARLAVLLRNIRFAPFIAHCFLYGFGFFVPYVYLPDMALDAGIEKDQAAWLVSSIGIADTLGRVCFGFLAGAPWVNKLYLYNTSVAIGGLAMTVGPLLQTFWALMIYAAGIGLFNGVAISLTSVICVELVGAEMLPEAYGIARFTTGVATCIGSPLAGWIYDVSGSYMYSFIFAGLSIALSGAILFGIPLWCGNNNQPLTGNGPQAKTGNGIGERTSLLGKITDNSD